MEDIIKSYYVTTGGLLDRDVEVNTLEELVEALKTAKHEWKEKHVHVQVYGRRHNELSNSLFIAEFTVGLDNDSNFVTYGL